MAGGINLCLKSPPGGFEVDPSLKNSDLTVVVLPQLHTKNFRHSSMSSDTWRIWASVSSHRMITHMQG